MDRNILMWVSKQRMMEILGRDRARSLFVTYNNPWNRFNFRLKHKMGTVKHRNHISNKVIDLTTQLSYVDVIDAINVLKSYKKDQHRARYSKHYDRHIADLMKVIKHETQ